MSVTRIKQRKIYVPLKLINNVVGWRRVISLEAYLYFIKMSCFSNYDGPHLSSS